MSEHDELPQAVSGIRCVTCNQPVGTSLEDHNLWRHPTPEQKAQALVDLGCLAIEVIDSAADDLSVVTSVYAQQLSTQALLVKAHTGARGL